MISYSEALLKIETLARSLSKDKIRHEQIHLSHANGKWLSQDLVSLEPIPSFTNSAMDGFAVCSKKIDQIKKDFFPKNGKVRLPILGCLAAGQTANGNFHSAENLDKGVLLTEKEKNGALEIMTGAVLDTTLFDAVIRVEDVEIVEELGVRYIECEKVVRTGDNVREKGSDIGIGQKILLAGTQIQPLLILPIASLGFKEVPVVKLPSVSLFSTGNELVSFETKELPCGKIRNSTGPYLEAEIRKIGLSAGVTEQVDDDPSKFEEKIRNAVSSGSEIVISTGAVSMGKFDFVLEALKNLDANIVFHKVAIRPGKPILLAQLELEGKRAVYFGLPGNPLSTAVGLEFFVKPFVNSLLNLESPKNIKVQLGSAVKKPRDFDCFYKAFWKITEDARVEVNILENQNSYVVGDLMRTNGWAILESGRDSFEKGETVNLRRSQGRFS